MNYYVIFLGVIVLILLYFLYVNYVSSSTVLNPLVNLNNKTVDIEYNDLVKRGSSRYSYGVWIYINSWSSNNIKTIISRGSSSDAKTDFILYLDQNSPILRCMINDGTNSKQFPQDSIVITNNFPIQKWTYVIVSVDNQIIDFYLDGKLVLSKKIDYIPKLSEKSISLGDGKSNDIFLANVVRTPNPTDPQTAWNSYLSGNGQNNNSNMNIKLAVLQDNVEQKQFTLL